MTSPDALTALLELQALDSQVHSIMGTAQAVRTSETVSALVARRAQAIQAAKDLDAAAKEATQAVERAEATVREIQAKIDRDTDRLNRGGSAKELMGTQHEIDTLTRRRAAAEERQFEAMEHAESVAADRERKLPLLRAADAEARQAVAQRDEELATLKSRHGELTGRRPGVVNAVGDTALVASYDALRNARGGGRIAVARFQEDTCGACGTHYSPGDAQTIRETPPDTVPTCLECSAMLVR